MSGTADTTHTITQTATVGLAPAGWNDVLRFQQFDPSLGTLTGVEVAVTSESAGTVSVTNLDVQPAFVDAYLMDYASVGGALAGIIYDNFTGPSTNGTAELGAGATTVFANLAETSVYTNSLSASSSLTPFVGTGILSIPVSDHADLEADWGSGVALSAAAQSSATVSLQYDYVPAGQPPGGGYEGGDLGAGSASYFGDESDPDVYDASNRVVRQIETITQAADGTVGTFSFAPFDPSLGTLVAVDGSFASDLRDTLRIENLTTGSADASLYVDGAATLTGPAGEREGFEVGTITADTKLGPFDGTVDAAGSSGQRIIGFSTATSELISANLSDVTGPGPVTFNMAGSAESGGDFPESVVLRDSLQVIGTLELDYVYTPPGAVPTSQFVTADELACFAGGTRLATPAGERPVEALRAGDGVLTARGTTERVIWVGQRTLAPARHPRPWDVNPVYIAPRAFGPDQPARELVLSPDHAVFVDGVLIPVRYLLNDATIVQRAAERITYHHVELPRHDVLLAEALPCESYLDTGNRSVFAGEATTVLHPDFARDRWARDACVPLVLEGPALAAVRQKLLKRVAALGFRLTGEPRLRAAVGKAILRPVRAGEWLGFRLPPGTAELRLLSRAAVPARVRPADPDHRRLGVAVTEIVAPGTDIAFGAGWLPPEDGWRWTDGDAALRLDGRADRLMLRLLPLLRYWVAPASGRRAAA